MAVLTNDKNYDWLPTNFRNVIVDYNERSGGLFEATVRTSASTKEEMAQWIGEFEHLTKTKWLMRSTCPKLQRLAYRIDYVCQHSSFNKHATKRASKNCECPAKLTQKISLVTRHTKQSNPLIKVYCVT